MYDVETWSCFYPSRSTRKVTRKRKKMVWPKMQKVSRSFGLPSSRILRWSRTWFKTMTSPPSKLSTMSKSRLATARGTLPWWVDLLYSFFLFLLFQWWMPLWLYIFWHLIWKLFDFISPSEVYYGKFTSGRMVGKSFRTDVSFSLRASNFTSSSGPTITSPTQNSSRNMRWSARQTNRVCKLDSTLL